MPLRIPKVNHCRKRRKRIHLPDVIVLNCLARISRSYYPKLSLVCKTFKSLISSKKLNIARYHLGTRQLFVHVCLQLPDQHGLSWFTLRIKPDQTLTNDLEKKKKKTNISTGNTRLVPIPSSYTPYLPSFTVRVGSEFYALSGHNAPSSVMRVGTKKMIYWPKAPNMSVARENGAVAVLNGKIYVMGSCGANESANWTEVFDQKTQTWEPLPDPGVEIRSSIVKTIAVNEGKLLVISNEKDYIYDPKESKWDVAAKDFVGCMIENVCYGCDEKSYWWYDTKRKKKEVVRGLAMLNRNPRHGMIAIATDGEKLLIYGTSLCILVVVKTNIFGVR